MTAITNTAITNNVASLALASTAAATRTNDTLDQSAFLKLMTTQLKTQDPFNPVDNTQMVAQMAQFSSVAGIAEMNKSLKTISEGLTSRVGDAASWIGRSALVPSDTAMPLTDGSFAGEITLPQDATNLGYSLVDANGRAVHSETLGAQAKGAVGFHWDGKDAEGNAVAGPLKLLVTAANADGTIAASTSTWTGIAAVQSPAGGSAARLVTSLGLVAPEDAQRLG